MARLWELFDRSATWPPRKSVLNPKKCGGKSHELVIWSAFYWPALALMFILFQPGEISYCPYEMLYILLGKTFCNFFLQLCTWDNMELGMIHLFFDRFLSSLDLWYWTLCRLLYSSIGVQDGVIAISAPCRSARFQAGGWGCWGEEGVRVLGWTAKDSGIAWGCWGRTGFCSRAWSGEWSIGRILGCTRPPTFILNSSMACARQQTQRFLRWNNCDIA